MITIIRRAALLALAAVLVLGIAAPVRLGAADLPTVRVGKAQAVALVFIPIEVGEAAGIWKDVGIQLETSSLRGDGQVQQALTGGNIDIGLGSGPGLGFLAKGVPAIGVAAAAGPPDSMAIYIDGKSPVKTVADLKGKKIAVTTKGSLTDWLVKQLATQQGWDPEAITTVPLGDAKSMIAAMQTGQVDGECGAVELGYDLQDRKEGKVLLNFGPIIKDFHTHIIFARNDFVAQHPDLVKKFLVGWFRSVKYMKAHRAESIQIAMKAEGMDESATTQSYDAFIPMMSTDGQYDNKALDRLSKSFVELGILDAAPDMSKLITRQFVPVKT
jgi:ABC-type nitrate/sulfonate/bicarbonate transport system substrate-binding protein